MALMLLAMLFPKLIALLLGNLVRFVLRGVATLAGSLLQEIFFQASALIGELEQHLICLAKQSIGSAGPCNHVGAVGHGSSWQHLEPGSL